MAYTYTDYVGNGSETQFDINFDYIKTSHVAVEVNEGPAGGTNTWVRKVLGSDYTVVTSPTKKVVFTSAPANLVRVRVLRDSDANIGIVDFANGSVLTETELDNAYNHNRYLAQEAEEGVSGGGFTKNTDGQYDADGLRIENLAAPDSDDDAVNKGYADGRYVDVAGDTMTGDLTLNADPTSDLHAATKQYVDGEITTAVATEASARASGDNDQVSKTGDTMTGALTLDVDPSYPSASLHASTKQYVDNTVASVTAGTIPDGSITTAKIADDAVTAAKLADSATTDSDRAVTTDHIKDDAVTTAKIADDAVTAAKLDNTTVTPGSYTNTDITVDENGRITAASSGTASGEDNVQANWNETDNTSDAFILNKPTIPSTSDDLTEGSTNLFNQTHTGDVTGSTALTIDAGAVTSDKISSTDTNFNINQSTGHVGIGEAADSNFHLNVNSGTDGNICNLEAARASGAVAAYIRNLSTTGISSILQLIARSGGTAITRAISLDLQCNPPFNEYFQIGFVGGDQCAFRFNNSTGSNSGEFFPSNNGTQDLGTTSFRWDDIWSNGTFNGSDRNIKQDIQDLDEAEKRVAVKCKGLIKKYRLKDAVAKKGNDARIHVGIIAQELQAAFESEGLDAFRYSMIGKDTWYEGKDENNERVVKDSPAPGYIEVTQMSVRYNELLAFIISAM